MLSEISIFFGVLAAVLTAVPDPIIRSNINPDGSFQWSYDSQDGSSQQQEGKQLPGPDGGQAVQGAAQWTDPEGGLHQLQYVAGENGYLPSSADLPLAPEIPAAIRKGLEWNAAHPEEDSLV